MFNVFSVFYFTNDLIFSGVSRRTHAKQVHLLPFSFNIYKKNCVHMLYLHYYIA